MFQINKVQIPANSGFKLERAIELANLISVAYNEFEVWDWIENSTSERSLPPKIITGSNAFIDLHTDNLEEVTKDKNKIMIEDYKQLNQFWNQKQDKLQKYDRIANFWFPQWWWGEVLKPESLLDFFKKDIRNIWQNFKDLIGEDQIFGFIARSQTETNQIFVVFRGTREPAEWFNNFRPVPRTFLEDEDLGEVRNGFNTNSLNSGNR